MFAPIRAIDIVEDMSVADLVSGFSGCAFGAGRVATACEIYREMLEDSDCLVFFGLAGAMVPAGMRKVVSSEIKAGNIDLLVTTGANIVHDVIEAIGLPHLKGTEVVDDVKLYKNKINRIYDVFLPESYFSDLEEWLQGEVFPNLPQAVSIRELCSLIGERLEDPHSILKCAFDAEVPVFCPAVQDSIIGLQAWLYKQSNSFTIDALADMQELIDLCYEAKHAGAFFVGGGVPKNFILQSMLLTPKDFDYAIQLTMDRPETGGLSGATLDEARSWGKIGENAKSVAVYSDATITLPLIVAAAKDRSKRVPTS
ncbi:MAG: deoxyhypusine synthase [Candidatus Argoarchaeum ethanivorans]|uniref:Deoxyhypusine synthase n=1 Tax=Candidatus Argoarchaeum ethanivorans TaxID=2608793 RepID=A0A8B3S3R2_9EURY|nr:MAG: deoxyhypusine synthase [Candidatus Argoarchaeum ethanivorans]